MPPLKAVIDSLTDVEEPYRALYEESDGKFVFAGIDIESHPATEALRNTAVARRKERERVERELKAWRDLGLTVEQVAELKSAPPKSDETDPKPPQGGPDLEALRVKWRKEFEAEIAGEREELAQLRTENRTLQLDDRLGQAFLAAGGRKEDIGLMLLDTRSRFDLDDQKRVVVRDDDGDPLAIGYQEWFAKHYKKARPNLYDGTPVTGSGAKASSSGGAGESDVRKLDGRQMIEAAFTATP